MAEKYKIHPYCEIFPDITGEEYEELKADIAANGLQNPIWRWGVQILDGKNRLRVCQEIKLTPEFRDWRPSAKARDGRQQEAEALTFVIAQNMNRRHLNESQRAMVAAKLATLTHGGDRKSKDQVASLPLDREAAATLMNVSPRSVTTAREVIDKGSSSLQEAVETGAVAVSDAAKIVDLPKAEQTAAVKAVEAGEARTVAQAAKPKTASSVKKDGNKTIANAASVAINKQYGALQRAIDDLAASGKKNNSPNHKAATDGLSASRAAFKELAKQCEK